MSAPKSASKKKPGATRAGNPEPENSLLDLIQPDDSLATPSADAEADDPLALFAPDSSESQTPMVPDRLNDLASEFGADFGSSGETPEDSGGAGDFVGLDEIPGLAPPISDADAEGLGISTSSSPGRVGIDIPITSPSPDEVTSAFNTLLGSSSSSQHLQQQDAGGTADLAGLVSPDFDEASATANKSSALELDRRPPERQITVGAESFGDDEEETETASSPEAPLPPTPVLENVKLFSNQLASGKTTVAAAYPFSLLITGRLRPVEREKLLDLLSRADLGIREPDIEPQFEAGRVLIPRISEYAGILIIQALRTAAVEFRLGPSDSIFATTDTRTADEEKLAPLNEGEAAHSTADYKHDADSMPITAEASHPQFPNMRVVDFVTASAAISTSAVEAERSSEYAELLEALQRELKYKAFRRGAQAIVAFTANLTSLASPTRYRLTVSGSAIRSLPGGGSGSASARDFLPESAL